MAGPTGLEPATSGVTGDRWSSNEFAEIREPAPTADSDAPPDSADSVRECPRESAKDTFELDANSSDPPKRDE
jgi:hypothetical protein